MLGNPWTVPLTSMTARHVRFVDQAEPLDYLVISVTDDSGNVGHAEACDCFGYRWPMVGAAIATHMAELAQRSEAGRGSGVHAHVTAALHNAVLDLAGQRRGCTVAELLGGVVQNRVPIYASAITLGEGTPTAQADRARRWLDRGVAGVKVRLGDDLPFELERLRQLRANLGADVDMMADANEKLDPDAARRALPILVDLGIRWLEEPVPATSFPALTDHRGGRHLPIAFGEHVYSAVDLGRQLDAAPFEIFQIDASIASGLTESMRMVELANSAGLGVVAHNAAGPLAFAANLHLAAATGLVQLMEYPFPVTEFWDAVAPRTGAVTISEGTVGIDDMPGLGVELDVDVLDRCTVWSHRVELDAMVSAA